MSMMTSEPGALVLLNQAVRMAKEGGTPTANAVAAWPDAARRMLAEAASSEEFKLIRDKASTVAASLRAQRVYEAEANRLREVAVDAARAAGRIIPVVTKPGSHTQRLPPGITHKQSSAWQRLASIPDGLFEDSKQRVIRCGDLLSEARVLRAAGVREERRPRRPGCSSAVREEEAAPGNIVRFSVWQRGLEPGEQKVGISPPLSVVEFDQHFPARVQTSGREGDIVAIVVAPSAPGDDERLAPPEDEAEPAVDGNPTTTGPTALA